MIEDRWLQVATVVKLILLLLSLAIAAAFAAAEVSEVDFCVFLADILRFSLIFSEFGGHGCRSIRFFAV